VLIIPDATQDHRFADNPLVLNDPKIRFYAGRPLCVNGYNLGTLCIIDQVPRAFGKDDIEALEDLASMAERELAAVQMATMDDLTNLSNRRGFMSVAQHSLKLCLRQKLPVVLVFFDLDKFKPINDKFGHAEGDTALIAFSTLMKKELRGSDLFARLGGDEFAALFSNTSKEQVATVIERFGQTLKDYNHAMKVGYDLSFSYGIVEFDTTRHASIEQLLAECDSRMYQLKQSKDG
jgi:diguanylate cyclase (GGDEF)-like protein